jgi:hypothetical protein
MIPVSVAINQSGFFVAGYGAPGLSTVIFFNEFLHSIATADSSIFEQVAFVLPQPVLIGHIQRPHLSVVIVISGDLGCGIPVIALQPHSIGFGKHAALTVGSHQYFVDVYLVVTKYVVDGMTVGAPAPQQNQAFVTISEIVCMPTHQCMDAFNWFLSPVVLIEFVFKTIEFYFSASFPGLVQRQVYVVYKPAIDLIRYHGIIV